MKQLIYIPLLVLALFGCADENKKETVDTLHLKNDYKALILPNYNEISSLDELINQPQFNDKILVINLYNRYCGFSTSEFRHLPELKKLALNPDDFVFIHLSTPKWTFASTWKGAIKEYNLEGYHVLMNSEFYDEFWINFPNVDRSTPFYLHVDKYKNISEIPRPSILMQMSEQNTPFNKPTVEILRYVQLNINDIKSTLDHDIETIDILINFKRDYLIRNISSTTKKAKNKKHTLHIPSTLDSCIQANFRAVAKELDMKQYGFTIPLTEPELENSILQLSEPEVEM